MSKPQTLLPVITTIMFLMSSAHANEPTKLAQVLQLWEQNAPYCDSRDGTPSPSKEHCDDGDMTLFNGLLCAAGDVRGCDAVRNAQDASGRWFRSPRLRVNHHAEGASLSPDMALGIQLYLVTSRDTVRAYQWLKQIDDTVPCWLHKPFSTDCWIRGVPRFCQDSANCSIRPGDAEILATTVDYLHQQGMPPLPNGSLRGYLGTFGSTWINDYNAHTNKLGYSLHLVAVESWLLKLMGHTSPSIQDSIITINKRDPGNPFFEYLRDGPTTHVQEILVNTCPKDEASLPRKYFQWAWEREMREQAWKETMLWDCIFLARLLHQ